MLNRRNFLSSSFASSVAVGASLAWRGQVTAANHTGAELVAWYWHFVDVVWVVVFTVVYVVGR